MVHFGRVPARIHQETARAAGFLGAAAPPNQHHRVLLALLTPPPWLETDVDLVARAPTPRYSDTRQSDISSEHAPVP